MINKKIISNKKGFLLAEETLKTVIAVISIGLLVYFLTSLYMTNLNETNQKSAEASLDKIELFVNSVNDSLVLSNIGPEGWSVFSFVEEEKPNTCLGKSCICICDEVVWDAFGLQRQLKECGEVGKCLIVENLQNFETFEIVDAKEGLTGIEIKKSNNEIFVEKIK